MKKSEKRILKALDFLAQESVHPGQIDMIRKMTECLNDSVNLLVPNESVTHIKEVGKAFSQHWDVHMAKKAELEAKKNAR